MSMPKDPEKFKVWLSYQSEKTQRRWTKPGALEAHWERCKIRSQLSRQRGPDSPRWKGDDVQIKSLHLLIPKNKPRPDACEVCNEPEKKTPTKNGKMRSNIELASINHTYTRNPDDYIWLCCGCHKKMDKTQYNRLTRGKQNFFNQYYQANISIIPAL